MPQIKLLKPQWNIFLAPWPYVSALLTITTRERSKNEVEWGAGQGVFNWGKKKEQPNFVKIKIKI